MDLEIELLETSFVAPSMATPRKGLWVSSLDLQRANRGHTPVVYFYPRPCTDGSDNFFDTTRLKESMAKALVAFYPFAGRVGVDNNGRMEIKCNSEGALFVVARSELALDDMMPLPELIRRSRLFVPRVEPSSITLAVQVTFLKCGAVVLGTAFDHMAADAASYSHFVQTWSAFSRDGDDGGASVEPPCHDRTLLCARSPPVVHPGALSLLYRAKATSRSSSESSELSVPATAASVFTISKDQLEALKRICGSTSAFCAVSALMWQCACAARRLRPDAEARLAFSADCRRRRRCTVFPGHYFGNGILTVSASGAARDIASGALGYVASRIRAAADRVDEELVRSAIDYYHERSEMALQSSCRLQPPGETDLWIVSWLGMPLYDADFGWGKPWRVSRAGPVHHGGCVHLVKDGPEADSGIRAFACMEAANMKEFERLLYAKLAGLTYCETL